MIRPLARIALVLALLFSVGGHWVVLQSLAWASMLVEHSQSGSLASAITKTFDGQHPCKLCKAVDAGSQDQPRSERKGPNLKLKIELFSEDVPMVVLVPSIRAIKFIAVHEVASRRAEQPLQQPPRAV